LAIRRGTAAALALATAVVLTPAALLAGTGKERIRLNAADQRAARAATVRRTDLGSGAWSGGRVKPDLSPGPTCPNYHPKQSDLVLTGAAESTFRNGPLAFDSQVQVLQTKRMVSLDWRRELLAPGAIPCLRRHLGKNLGSSAKVLSFVKAPFPRLARYTAAFRARVDVAVLGKTAHLIVDSVLIGRSRTEISLTTVAPAAARSAVAAAERRLARRIVGRARA
jgi:hypothetical protein